jgi:hypothetical protein
MLNKVSSHLVASSFQSVPVVVGGPAHMSSIAAAAHVAARWRLTWGFSARGGFVQVLGHEVVGWVNELTHPDRWPPGVHAVAQNGRTWTSIGGSAVDGALMWLPNFLIELDQV